LYHVAFKAGDSIDDLRQAKEHFDALGILIDAIEDHVVARGIYLRDPDGNAIEVYVDTSDVWRTDPQAVASIFPLTL
jgi:catechol 2,3-dioxygenase